MILNGIAAVSALIRSSALPIVISIVILAYLYSKREIFGIQI